MSAEPRMDAPTLQRHLSGVTQIPILPFGEDGEVDLDGHRRNVRFLIEHNHLEGGLERVVGIGGTSLVHHVDPEHLTTIVRSAGSAMGDRGVLMSGLPANMAVASRLASEQMALERPPDVFLMMPMEGLYRPQGLLETYLRFAERHGPRGARLVAYMKNSGDLDAHATLLARSEYFVAVKVGSGLADLGEMVGRVDEGIRVLWGSGDIGSTAAAKEGGVGHTSGSGIVCGRLCDEINNAYRRGAYGLAEGLEDRFRAFEHVRLELGYGYAAFVEALALGGSDDTVGGVGHPLNPRVPADISAMIKAALEPLLPYHT